MTWLRMLMLLALIVWIGGIIFFAFVLAPTAFNVLPNPNMAALVVGPSLTELHWLGIVSGVILLISSLFYNSQKHAQLKPFAVSHILVILMLAFTLISQFGVTPRMHALMPPFSREYPAAQREFERLHAWSERLEGGVLFLGLGVVVLTARRFGESN